MTPPTTRPLSRARVPDTLGSALGACVRSLAPRLRERHRLAPNEDLRFTVRGLPFLVHDTEDAFVVGAEWVRMRGDARKPLRVGMVERPFAVTDYRSHTATIDGRQVARLMVAGNSGALVDLVESALAYCALIVTGARRKPIGRWRAFGRPR